MPDGGVAISTLGCKVNRVDSDEIARALAASGVAVVNAADQHVAAVVINTCTVTAEADAKARKAVRQAIRSNEDAVVLVTGCLAALDPEGLVALGANVIVEPDKSKVADRLAALLGHAAVDERERPLPSPPASSRTRAQLKIQDGCDNFCTYCIVPYARGVPRSIPLDAVARRAEEYAGAGFAEVVLTGINLGRYADGAADLADVVRVVAATGIARVRLSSIEPVDLDDRLIATLAQTPAACAHVHVPLQSGSDRLLRAMGRHYTVAEFVKRVEAARASLPGLAVTTDVIAGFPGETRADHEDSLAACRAIGFSKMHVFRYSKRSGTPAAEMDGQVPSAEKAARAAELRRAADEMRAAFTARIAKRPVEVLVERVRSGVASGTTREYLHVEFPAGPLTRPGGVVVREPGMWSAVG